MYHDPVPMVFHRLEDHVDCGTLKLLYSLQRVEWRRKVGIEVWRLTSEIHVTLEALRLPSLRDVLEEKTDVGEKGSLTWKLGKYEAVNTLLIAEKTP